jgi:hypothetical protein
MERYGWLIRTLGCDIGSVLWRSQIRDGRFVSFGGLDIGTALYIPRALEDVFKMEIKEGSSGSKQSGVTESIA